MSSTAAGQLRLDLDPGPVRTGPSFLEWLKTQPPHFDRDWPTSEWATRLTARYHADLHRRGLTAPPLSTSTHQGDA